MSGKPAPGRIVSLLGVAALMLFLTGCDPLVNAPPGGGETVTQTFRYGPFTLGPGQEVQGAPSSGMPRPSGAFGLKSAKFNVVDQNGTPVSAHDVHLHHIVMTTSARQDALCPGRAERFMGAGMERTPINFWGPYAYQVRSNDKWGSIYHLMNETPAGTPAKTLYIEYTLGYQPGATSTNSRFVTPYFMDVTGCGNSVYDVPGDGGPGSVHEKSRSWTAPVNGMAVFAGGHLHDGGINISLKEDPPGWQECIGTANYHENPHHLAAINSCSMHQRVVAGNRYTVTARYDNSQPWEDVMGIVMAYIWHGTQ